MENYCDESFDSAIKAKGSITWLPWIGTKYKSADNKILIVAESHYALGNTQEEVEYNIKSSLNDEFFTRECIWESVIDGDWQNKMTENLHRALVKTNDFNKNSLWDNIAFYNFVQRPMDYTKKERPQWIDYFNGWKSFIDLVDILNPDECLFVGVESSNSFCYAMESQEIPYEQVEWLDGQGAYGRKFAFIRNDKRIPVTSIKHTSQFFSWEQWHQFLTKNAPSLLKNIYSYADCNVDDTQKLEEILNGWMSVIPTWLQHKPIVACDYSKIDDYADAKFISVGHAQYATETEASVKIWRHTGEKWSRQSEELPISRVPDAFLILLCALRDSYPELTIDQKYKTFLNEEVLKEGELNFLRDCFMRNKFHLKKSLLEVKNLLNSLDIEKF